MKTRSILFASLLVAGVSSSSCQSPSSNAKSADSAHTAEYVESLEPYSCGSIQRMHTMGGIFLASQPSVDDLEQAKMGGIQTIINQRPDGENKDFDEGQVVRGLDLHYANPAWNGPDQLTDEVLDQTRRLLREAKRPILIHCASANRTGTTWLAYRVLDEGLSLEEATVEAERVGMRSEEYERIVVDYISRMQAK
jgi:uncharacterized protein (TIGR01244 family)